jgi:hypothetical protein
MPMHGIFRTASARARRPGGGVKRALVLTTCLAAMVSGVDARADMMAMAHMQARGAASEHVDAILAGNKALAPENGAAPAGQVVVDLTDPDVVAQAQAQAQKAGNASLYNDFFRFAAAVQKVRRLHADTLNIPHGTYHIYPTAGLPNGAGLIQLSDLSHVTIEGNGSTLLFASIGTAAAPLLSVHPRGGIVFTRTDHITLHNVVLDWSEPLAVPVTVSGSPGGRQTLTVDPAYPIDPAVPMPIRIFIPFDVVHRNYGLAREMSPADLAAWYAPYQPGGAMPYTCPAAASNAAASACFQHQSGQVYVFGPSERFGPVPPHAGNFLASVRDNGFGAVIVGGASSFVTLDGVVVYSSPGQGIQLINAGQGLHVVRCRVVRKPDELLQPGEPKRLISTLSDALNVITSGGDVVIEDSEFAFSGDDTLNIRSDMRGGQAADGATLMATQAAVANYYRAGSTVDLYANGGRDLVARHVPVAQVVPPAPGQNLYRVMLQPGAVQLQPGTNYLIRDPDWDSGRVVVRNNWFHDNSERGAVVHGSNVAIINNRFERSAETAIELLYDNVSGHPEGPPASDVVISGNTIRDSNVHWFDSARRSFAAPAAIAVYFQARSAFVASQPLAEGNIAAHSIMITDNAIDSVPGAGILVSQADDVTIARNHLTQTGLHAFNMPLIDGHSIAVEYTTNLHMQENVTDKPVVVH